MTHRPLSPPAPPSGHDPRITAAHAEDVARARALIGGAVARADEAWLPWNAVVAALTSELAMMGLRAGGPDAVAAHLRAVASLLEMPCPGSRPS